MDIHLPEMDGVELLRHLKRHDPSIEVLMMTGDPTVATAVETLKLGAYDYLTKPLVLEELRHLLDHILERRLLRQEVNALRSRLGEQLRMSELVGVSPAMEALKGMIVRVAPADSPVLIEGESGTGKELVAAAIHRLSARASGPFITVNCGAVPSDLLESEFFGHVRGAFSGAVADTLGLFRSAHGGTIFLDEVAELPPRSRSSCCACSRRRTCGRWGRREATPSNQQHVVAALFQPDGVREPALRIALREWVRRLRYETAARSARCRARPHLRRESRASSAWRNISPALRCSCALVP